MKSVILGCVAALALGVAGAKADAYHFSLQGDSTLDFTIEGPPSVIMPGDWTVYNSVVGASNGLSALIDVEFVTSNSLGTDMYIQIDDPTLPAFTYVFLGPQLYSGPESAPLFNAPSTSDLTFFVFDGPEQIDGGYATLAITEISAAPEPSTWALMLLGLGGLGVALRGRRPGVRALIT